MDSAFDLLEIAHFDVIKCPNLRAVHEFLYRACLRMGFITGEKTDITEAYKRNFAQLTFYPMYE